MENNIIQANNMALTEAKLNDFLNIAGVGRNLPDQQRQQFVEIAQAYQLNPFKREIYCISYGGNTSIITGYEVYIKRAERSGKLNGWNVEVSGTGEDMLAKITIYRKDWEKPFTHEVYFAEAANRNKAGELTSIWQKMPRFMLKKVAIAQGFRMCFSDELGGMPYTQDEIGEPVSATTVKAVKPAILDEEPMVVEATLPASIMQQLAAAKTKEELKDLCIGAVKAYGDGYRTILQDYYRQHSGALA